MTTLKTDAAQVTIMFLGALIMCVLGAVGLGCIYHALVVPPVIPPDILVAPHRSSPEPDERFVFTTLAIIIPAFCFIAAYLFEKDLVRLPAPLAKHAWLLYVIGAIVFIGPMLGFEFSWWLFDKKHVHGWSPALLMLFSLIAFGWYRAAGPQMVRARSRNMFGVELGVFLAAVLLQITMWRVASVRAVFHDWAWDVHFDAAIYTLSQVVMGKTILADLPSQYGLAPEFLSPIFKLFGLSTLSFTKVCAVMQVVSLCCVWWTLNRCVHDRALRVFASVALVMLTFETVLFLVGLPERYFQYWPIRFFWPAVSVLMFYRYSRQGTLWSGALVSLVGSIAALWNADSGVMVVLAFTAFLGFKLLAAYMRGDGTQNLRRALWQSAAVHCATVALIFSVFLAYLALKAHDPLNLSWLYEYQVTFYKLGFMMERMPTYPSAWMTVIAVYIMGLSVGFVGLLRGRQSWALDNILYLSMLGVGLFVYYQGRSHILNLITVSWPAVLVGSMLSDRALRIARAIKGERGLLVLPASALSILAFCAAPFIWNVSKFFNTAVALVENRHQVASEVVQDEIRFIRDHSAPGESCVILSIRQGIYYAEAKLVSPLSGPGYVEGVLQKDRDSMLDQLRRLRPTCVFFGLGNSAQDLGPDAIKALSGYRVVTTNSAGTMQYLTPSD